MSDVIMTPDGWIYGVRFGDGSVSSRWSGRTQRERAAEEIAAVHRRAVEARGLLLPVDTCTLVRRRAGGSWESVPDE